MLTQIRHQGKFCNFVQNTWHNWNFNWRWRVFCSIVPLFFSSTSGHPPPPTIVLPPSSSVLVVIIVATTIILLRRHSNLVSSAYNYRSLIWPTPELTDPPRQNRFVPTETHKSSVLKQTFKPTCWKVNIQRYTGLWKTQSREHNERVFVDKIRRAMPLKKWSSVREQCIMTVKERRTGVRGGKNKIKNKV